MYLVITAHQVNKVPLMLNCRAHRPLQLRVPSIAPIHKGVRTPWGTRGQIRGHAPRGAQDPRIKVIPLGQRQAALGANVKN